MNEIMRSIQARHPAWIHEHGICQSCWDSHRSWPPATAARPLFAASVEKPGVKGRTSHTGARRSLETGFVPNTGAPSHRTAGGHADQLIPARAGGRFPIIVKMNSADSSAFNSHRHPDPQGLLRLGGHDVPAGRQGDNTRRRLVMSDGIGHVSDPLAMQVVNVVVRVLIPGRSAIAALISIIALLHHPGEDLQRAHGSRALAPIRIRPDRRENDRRGGTTAKPKNHHSDRKESICNDEAKKKKKKKKKKKSLAWPLSSNSTMAILRPVQPSYGCGTQPRRRLFGQPGLQGRNEISDLGTIAGATSLAQARHALVGRQRGAGGRRPRWTCS